MVETLVEFFNLSGNLKMIDRNVSTVSSSVRRVSPALAAEWLDRSDGNRPLNADRVDNYRSLIEEGRFVVTHQGIGFYIDGGLADGHHRLKAIVQAGRDVSILVTHGLARDVVHSIDVGRSRTIGDMSHFLGDPKSIRHISCCRVLQMQYKTQMDGSAWNKKAAGGDAERFFVFAKHVEAAADFGVMQGNARGVGNACLSGAIASAWFTVNRVKLLRFKSLLMSGVDADGGERAAIKLREYLLTTNTSGVDRQELYGRCCTALRAFFEGRDIMKLCWRREAAYPIPTIGTAGR